MMVVADAAGLTADAVARLERPPALAARATAGLGSAEARSAKAEAECGAARISVDVGWAKGASVSERPCPPMVGTRSLLRFARLAHPTLRGRKQVQGVVGVDRNERPYDTTPNEASRCKTASLDDGPHARSAMAICVRGAEKESAVEACDRLSGGNDHRGRHIRRRGMTAEFAETCIFSAVIAEELGAKRRASRRMAVSSERISTLRDARLRRARSRPSRPFDLEMNIGFPS